MKNDSAGQGPLERPVRPLAVRLAQRLQTAAYSHGYEDAHPACAWTRQDKCSAASQQLLTELREECERLHYHSKDTERLDWLMHRLSGKELRRIGIETSSGGPLWTRVAIDAAMMNEAAVASNDGLGVCPIDATNRRGTQ